MEDIPRRPVNKQVTMDVNLKVEALIQKNGQWNKESVQNLFPMNEMTRILQLPVGQTPDRLIWAYTSHGSYTVKSGYQLASRDKENKARQLASSEQGVLELKQDIWKVPTIPKIRSFMWRAASGALAVTERLTTRGMQLNTTCKLCQAGSESIEHVLFKCAIAQDFWLRVGIQMDMQLLNRPLVEILSKVLKLMDDVTVTKSVRQVIPWLMWTIWKNRNSIVYAATQISMDTQIQQACEEARIWNELNDDPAGETVGTGLLDESKNWEPPIYGFAKCNIYANWRNAKLHSGGAFIIRDSSGNVLHHARDAFTFSPNRLTSELRCMEWALQSMQDLGYKEIIIASDLHDLITAVTKSTEWPRFRLLLHRISNLCLQFEAVAFETESSLSNSIARKIAKSVLRDGRFQSYLALGGPAWLHQQIFREAALISS